MEYFLKDSYHTLLCSLGFVGIGVLPMEILHKLVPSLLLAQCESFSFWEAMMFHRTIIFFSFALLNLSPFSSNPLVGGNCPKVSEMKGNFTWDMNFAFMLLLSEILSEIRKLCEVNFIGKKCLVYSDFFSFIIFTQARGTTR